MPVLPKNTKVRDIVSSSRSVRDVRASNSFLSGETVVYTSTTTIFQGSPMGLLLALTYPVTFTSQGVRP